MISQDESMRQQFNETLERFKALAVLARVNAYPLIEAASRATADRTRLDQTVFGLFGRALGWAWTIHRLDNVFDFQAHSVGCRSLFEVVIDLVLLVRNSEPVEKLLEWERLSKFVAAEKTTGDPAGDTLVKKEAAEFIRTNAGAVTAARAKFWPKKSRPMRWTGESLFKDALRADHIEKIGLERLARDHYDRLCWGTHGSGLILVRELPGNLFPAYSIIAVHVSFDLLAHAMRLVLRHFKLWENVWDARISTAFIGGRISAAQKDMDAIAATPIEPNRRED